MFSEKKLQKVPDFVSIRCSSFFHSGARPPIDWKVIQFYNYILDIMMFVMH